MHPTLPPFRLLSRKQQTIAIKKHQWEIVVMARVLNIQLKLLFVIHFFDLLCEESFPYVPKIKEYLLFHIKIHKY